MFIYAFVYVSETVSHLGVMTQPGMDFLWPLTKKKTVELLPKNIVFYQWVSQG